MTSKKTEEKLLKELGNVKNKTVVPFCGKAMGVGCDGQCGLAIGIGWYLEDGETLDVEAIKEEGTTLEHLRKDPLSSEGGERKPASDSEFPNKWCVRQCERCHTISIYDM